MMATVPEMARRKQERKEHMAMLEGRDNSKRWPSLLRRSGSRAGSVRRDCATKVGRGWSTASYRWSSIMGAEAEGLAASMSSSLTDIEMLEDDTTTKCDDGTDDLARG